MIAYQFTKKEDRKHGVTTIECGDHRAIVYKVGKTWRVIAGFVDPHNIAPRDRHYDSGGFRTRNVALFHAEAAITEYGVNGCSRLDCDVEYKKESR